MSLSELALIRPGGAEAGGIPLERFAGDGLHASARMSQRRARKGCPLDDNGELPFRPAMDTLGFSPRAHDQIPRAARPIADLAGGDNIRPPHVGCSSLSRQHHCPLSHSRLLSDPIVHE